jgi:hypothetical protein
MKYIYSNITSAPNIDHYDFRGEQDSGILCDIMCSTMVDKGVNCLSYQEDLSELWIFFVNELSSEDKVKLDTIVQNNPIYIEPVEIIVTSTLDPVKPDGTKVKIGVDENGILYTETL